MKNVLVVDDSETIRQQVAAALEPAGFVVLEAQDGMKGLECLANHAVDLVLLDVNMPLMNGLEMLERLKTQPKLAQLPVVMLTTEVEPALIERAKKAGAKGWIVKPVRPDHLLSTVNKLTE